MLDCSVNVMTAREIIKAAGDWTALSASNRSSSDMEMTVFKPSRPLEWNLGQSGVSWLKTGSCLQMHNNRADEDHLFYFYFILFFAYLSRLENCSQSTGSAMK